jgi:hypothetical protein
MKEYFERAEYLKKTVLNPANEPEVQNNANSGTGQKAKKKS